MRRRAPVMQVATTLLLSLMLTLPMASALTVTTTTSLNWSGYVATAPTPFTSVSATWTVPSVSSTSPPAYSSVWVGIGGYYVNSNKLIQAGTAQNVLSGGSTVYYVWYEVYPKAPVYVASVSAGDSITVDIHQESLKPSTWHIVITKDSTATLLNKVVKVKANFAAEATAEFVVERPLIRIGNQLTPLANFGSVTFSGCSTNQGGLGSLDNAKVIMTSDGTSSGTPLATPSSLDTTNSFTVTWNAAS